MLKQDYSITLHAYEPNDRVEQRENIQYHGNRGAYIGGLFRAAPFASDEEAINAAKRMWKENFPGTVRQIFVRNDMEIVFKADNFKEIGL